ncbi:hypothetical protein SCUCBS95973_002913 [Sporothrix curviconia]|uniref:Carboxylic ester hydrolase n=1 Tax=Sporothrix curviconia TaxID=1260050 RepID=A0ABP0BAX3_9PEZI
MPRNGKVLSLNNVAEPCTLAVPGGPTLHGFLSTHGVANFLNVPYARIPARFRTAEPVSLKELKGDLDNSQYGPRCPQPPDPIHILMGHMFECLPMEQYTDELSCLDVNIYIPPPGVDLKSKTNTNLPVFAWIHGGAFRAGCNTVEWDGNHLVARSMRLGRPIIVVAINYRLGVLGFLTSREIEAEARAAAAHAGGPAAIRNQGLNDQKLALGWIRQHIALFGGDPANVTVAGESAGAMSIHYLLKAKTDNDIDSNGNTPLFRRGLICSSPDVGVSLRTVSDGQAQFDALVQAAGVSPDASGEEKLAALRACSADELIAMLPPDMARAVPAPFPDRAWFVDWEASQEMPPKEYWPQLPDWCTELVVGSAKDEMALFLSRDETVGWTAVQAKEKLAVVLGHDAALVDAVWDAPSLQAPDGSTTPLGRLVAFGTDRFIRGPSHNFAAAVSRQSTNHRVYLYSIDIVDPFPGTTLDGAPLEGTGKTGALQGFAWHSFGNAIVFYQPACQRDAELGVTADKITEAHISIMYGDGDSVWQPYGQAGRKMSWNGTKSGMVSVGFAPYDPVGDYLKTLGNAAVLQAYEAFTADPTRLRGLLG